MDKYSLFIDESCHLEYDQFPAMCIGYVKVSELAYEKYKSDIKYIKNKYKTPVEIKWTGVSSSRLPMYKELVKYFFESSMEFRCILVKYKQQLDHKKHNNGNHQVFYHKLIYHLLFNPFINPIENQYKVFLDVVNSRNDERRRETKRVLDATFNGNSPFVSLQDINSVNPFTQLTDLIVGAIAYKARKEDKKDNASAAKIELITYIEELSGYTLDEGTPPWEKKFNIFNHQPQKAR